MADWARVENETILETVGELPIVWQNISNFNALDDDQLKELGWYRIVKNIPFYDSNTHFLDNPTYQIVDDVVYENYQVQPINREDPTLIIIENQWNKVREIRDQLMRDFDWRYSRYERQLRLGLTTVDSLENLDKYMQDLADITTQQDPFNVNWPQYN